MVKRREESDEKIVTSFLVTFMLVAMMNPCLVGAYEKNSLQIYSVSPRWFEYDTRKKEYSLSGGAVGTAYITLRWNSGTDKWSLYDSGASATGGYTATITFLQERTNSVTMTVKFSKSGWSVTKDAYFAW